MRTVRRNQTKLVVLALALTGLIAEASADVLSYAEYFWDSDPGVGNGVTVSVVAAESLAFGSPGSQVLSVSATNLSAGLHRLGFRVVDANGHPSDVNWLPVQVQNAGTLSASVSPSRIADAHEALVSAEYFWDTDPGVGSGTPLSVTAGQSFTFGAP